MCYVLCVYFDVVYGIWIYLVGSVASVFPFLHFFVYSVDDFVLYNNYAALSVLFKHIIQHKADLLHSFFGFNLKSI